MRSGSGRTVWMCMFIALAACADEMREETGSPDADAATQSAPAASTPSTPDAGGTVNAPAQTYDCGELRFTVRVDNSIAHIELPDRTVQLPLSSTSTGPRYTDGQSTFWEEQGRAHLELPEATYHDCEIAAPADTVPR